MSVLYPGEPGYDVALERGVRRETDMLEKEIQHLRDELAKRACAAIDDLRQEIDLAAARFALKGANAREPWAYDPTLGDEQFKTLLSDVPVRIPAGRLQEILGERDSLRAKLAEAEAGAAAMREALEKAKTWVEADCERCRPPFKIDGACRFSKLCITQPVGSIIQEALSSSAGREMLERLKRAEGLLRDLHPGNYGSPGWCDDCEKDGQVSSYHKNCVFREVCCAIDAYLNSKEGKNP